ncbi:MAG: 2-oxoglutarate dehydrogenase complex dihydrolipoyllysine-residue succinyltransferase [Myxococcota bacterium]
MPELVDIVIPSPGESISSVYIGSWMKKVGDSIAEGETLLEIDSDKASLEVPSPHSGVVMELLFEEGDEVDVGAVIARVDASASAGADARKAEPATSAAPTADDAGEGEGDQRNAGKTGPAARQAAQAHGVDIGAVSGSGRDGRVLRGDVEKAAQSQKAPVAQTAAPQDNGVLEERVRMTPLRRTIARRLVEAQQNAAMLTTFNEIDLTQVKAIRKKYQDRFVKKYGFKLGFMSFFVKAAVEALKQFPAVNAEIDGNEIVYKRYYNIGVAVSTERGLMVPVVRNADRLSFAEVEAEITRLATLARDGKLTPADFEGGTFTISNGGVFGSLMSTPIINPPQVGILGMHTIQDRPVGINGQIVLRPMMYVALSYDHRIIDGRGAVSFLYRIKELVEDPERILIEV